jgi:nicotinate phosphoribosyltransferase
MSDFFHIVGEEEIKKGKITDVYFLRDVRILRKKGIKKVVQGEARAASFPDGWRWAVFAGLEELAHLLEGLPINVYAMEEGTIFRTEEPVLSIEGYYTDFAIFETAILGFICQASGIATRAARCKRVAGERGVFSFGARRMHPAITPMIERNAYIGGCDAVAVPESAELIGEKPIGTMPHALIITMGSEEAAFKAFDEVIESEVKRVALIDTFSDEKFGALKAAEVLGEKLFAVRLDTPSSRRGNFCQILREVRWELDLRGYRKVKIVVSGGIDEKKISEFNPYVDAYGVGTFISNAPVVDFSFDLVEVDKRPVAKRGKMSGAKQVWRCLECFETQVLPRGKQPDKCSCGASNWESLLKLLIESGKLVRRLRQATEIRDYVLKQLARITD